MAIVGQRVIDLDEIERLISPYTYQGMRRINLIHPDNRAEVTATLRAKGTTHHGIRMNAVGAGNAAIAAIEAAGYEHASAPEISIGGVDTTRLDSEACDYLVQAELTMELLGKMARP